MPPDPPEVLDEQVFQEEHVYADPKKDPAVKVGKTRDRAMIVQALLLMMAVGLIGHYLAVIGFVRAGLHDSVKSLETILNAWLPVL
jgi:predicted component of type VI protein secretion system